jgi:hypothetical protein
MSVDKFKFISPGIFVNEIDNTGRSAIPKDVGPAIIGRSEKGPILQPVRINSYFDFVNIFGAPIPGGFGTDIVRNGNYTSPTYGAYAAQAWLKNNAPVTFIRLGGKNHSAALDTGGSGIALAGWETLKTQESEATPKNNGGAYGLFVTNAPTLDFGSASFSVRSGSAGVPVWTQGDAITCSFPVATTQGFVITASISDNTLAYDTFTTKGFATGSTSIQCLKNITGSVLLALTASGWSNKEFAIAITDATPDSLEYVTGTLLPNDSFVPNLATVTMEFDTTNTAAGTKPLTLRVQQGSTGAEEVVAAGATSSPLVSTLTAKTGTLAAVWYIDQSASIGLSGTLSSAGTTAVGSSLYIDQVGKGQFKVQIKDDEGVVVDSVIDFVESSENFVRKVFNTNPILTNNGAVKETSNSFSRYWLGESYEGAVQRNLGSDTTNHIGVMLPLKGATEPGGKFRKDWQNAESGWFFAQDLTTGDATGSYDVAKTQNLFKLVARNSGDWVARNIKVSIDNIKKSPNETINSYGTFSIVLRKLDDTDNRLSVVERFDNCNLNPNSQNYIARKIGDMSLLWKEADRRYVQLGDYQNLSQYVYVDLPLEVKKGDTDTRYLPFGVRGPLRFNSFDDATSNGQEGFVSGNLDDYGSTVTTFISGAAATNGLLRYEFPKLYLRVSASDGNPVNPMDSYFGVDATFNGSRLNASTRDHLKIKPYGIDDFLTGTLTEYSYNFTLDDMCMSGTLSDKTFVYKEDSRKSKPGSAERDGVNYARGTGSYTQLLEKGVDRFTTVFHGGFDGLDIRESEPFRLVNDANFDEGVRKNYAFNSVQVAIDSLRDAEVVEYNVVTMPGITNSTLNMSLIDSCESRGDALAIVDLAGGYTPAYESILDEDARRGNVEDTITTLDQNLIVDSSYAAAYYPWVMIKDITNGQSVWVPPSVAALGAMSYSQKASELWFAPAGFTRGGISSGKAGLPVVGVRDRLTSRERDKLYENRINPIAQFPAEGIVIFGQKTLQASTSALDRINVRRLMIFLKRQISRFAATILFDQNVRVTWNRFKGQVEPFLRGVQAGLGISEFRLVLDDTTTTPDLVDRNIMYAKIYIKPARAIEYIAIDFILTDSGAAFED